MMSFAAGLSPKRSGKSEPEQPAPERPKKNEAQVRVRDFIHEQMRVRGWNYSEFAKAVGTDGSVVSRWKRDRIPSPAMTRKMAKALGVDEDKLMTLVGHRTERHSELTWEQSELIAKIKQLHPTPEQYRILDLLIEDMRQRQP
jgi:transcriptional regulator with XRE-family HTH domain